MAIRKNAPKSERIVQLKPDVAAEPAPGIPDVPAARPQIRKKDFVDAAVTRAGIRRGEAKTAVEATLAELGERLARGEELQLPPLGKLRIVKEKDTGKTRVITLRLVRQNPGQAAAEPLAPAED